MIIWRSVVPSPSLAKSFVIARGNRKAILPPMMAIPKIHEVKVEIFMWKGFFIHRIDIVADMIVSRIEKGNQ